jgi:hypothetical protein
MITTAAYHLPANADKAGFTMDNASVRRHRLTAN